MKLLTFAELLHLHMNSSLQSASDPDLQSKSSEYMDEIRTRLDSRPNSIKEAIEMALAKGFLSKEEHDQVVTGLRIYEISIRALEELKQEKE